MNYTRELEVGMAAVAKAARLCLQVQERLITAQTIKKKDRSPVTVADFGSQALINHELMNVFSDPIIAEENASHLRSHSEICEHVARLVREQTDLTSEEMLDAIDFGAKDIVPSDRFWTVDPIDGTKGFLRGQQYAIALALIVEHHVVLGILGCPNFEASQGQAGAIFYAVKGEGVFMKSLDGNTVQPIHTDGLSDFSEARFCESVEKGHASQEKHERISKKLGIVYPPFQMDSQAKYAAVASGLASLYFRFPRDTIYREKIWDHAAGVIILEEAGGKATDFHGKDLDFSLGKRLENNFGILASNGILHSQTLTTIHDLKLL